MPTSEAFSTPLQRTSISAQGANDPCLPTCSREEIPLPTALAVLAVTRKAVANALAACDPAPAAPTGALMPLETCTKFLVVIARISTASRSGLERRTG